jgi:methylated-DNA-[protein]-cysteine S-methyltransferase
MITAYYKSPIGAIAVKADDNYITSVLFLSSESEVTEMRQVVVSSKEHLVIKQCFAQLDEYFAGTRKQFQLKIKQAGTEFQQSVWNRLLDIPYGSVISYLELSRKLNNVKAIRAVGQTNGNNNICIVVPCHRVVGSNGSLTGYSGELWRKKWLLEHEAAFAHGVQKLF